MWVHIVFIVYIYKYIHICNDLLDDGCELWLAIWLGIWARPKLLRIPMKSLFNFAKHEKNTSSSPFFNIMNHDHNPSISIINLPSYPDKTKMVSVSTKHDINNITFLASQQ